MSIKVGEKKILRSPLEPKDRNWLWLKTVAGFPVLHEYLSGKWVPFSDVTAEYVESNILSRVFGSTRYDKAGHCIEFYAADGSDTPIGVIDMSELEIPLDTDDYYTKDEVENYVAEYVSEYGGTNVDLSDYYTSSEVDAIASGKVDIVSGKGLSSNDYTDAEQIKLAGLENYDDSVLQAAVANKVDKETGKGLSTNDYTTAEKNKLAGIAAGAEVNVQPNWTQTNTSADDYIKNKPTKVSDFTNDAGYTTNTGTVTGISVNGGAEQQPTNGVVNLTVATGGDNDIVGISDGTEGDGAVIFTKRNGDTVTLNFNHVHSQYLKYELLADEAAYTALATKDSSTLYLIPES